MSSLAVIIGAGASFDCANPNVGTFPPELQPPLVSGLFDKRFNSLLQRYPRAASMADRILTELGDGKNHGGNDGKSLERVLRALATSRSPQIRRAIWEIPYYFRDLFLEIERVYFQQCPTRYDTLVQLAEESNFDHIVYVTTNYDRLIERALRALHGVEFKAFDDYYRHERWSVFKVHGSIDWARPLRNPLEPAQAVRSALPLPESEEPDLGEVECGVTIVPHPSPANNLWYPALSLPVDGEKDFIFPDSQRDRLRTQLADCSAWLTLGFSGVDRHVTEFLTANSTPNRLAIVNGSDRAGRETLASFRSAGLPHFVPEDVIFDCGFNNFVATWGLQNFLSVA